jgi:hypothetical protein
MKKAIFRLIIRNKTIDWQIKTTKNSKHFGLSSRQYIIIKIKDSLG